jgi:hypothetical protein
LGAQVVAGAHVVAGAEVVAADVVAAQPYASSLEAWLDGLTPNSRKANPTMDTIVTINITRRLMVISTSRSSSEVRNKYNTADKSFQEQHHSRPCWCPTPVESHRAWYTSLLAHSWCLHGQETGLGPPDTRPESSAVSR